MRVVIQRERCQGHARCAAVAPDLYPLNDLGFIATDGFAVPPGSRKDAERGARACPERAVSIVEDALQGKTA